MATAYLHVIDEEALADLLPLRRVGTWDGVLPAAPLPNNVRTTLRDGCAHVQAKGSLAAYAVLEGLQAIEPFEDGDLIPGTQSLPVVAFAPRMYEATMPKLAEVLRGYDRIIAKNFQNGRPGKPLGNIGNFAVQIYDDLSWAAPGRVSEEVIVWEVTAREEKKSKRGKARLPE